MLIWVVLIPFAKPLRNTYENAYVVKVILNAKCHMHFHCYCFANSDDSLKQCFDGKLDSVEKLCGMLLVSDLNDSYGSIVIIIKIKVKQ